MSITTHEQAELERLRAELAEWKAACKAAEDRSDQWQSDAADYNAQATALRAEVEALRRDAERYRWLRNVAPSGDWESIGQNAPEYTDAAIDAAMREQALQALAEQAQELGMGYEK